MTKLLDHSQRDGLPLLIVTSGLSEYTGCLEEVRNHPSFRGARIIDIHSNNAFSSPELKKYLYNRGVLNLVLGGYGYPEGVVTESLRSARRYQGYNTFSAKTLLFADMNVTEMPGIKEIESYFTGLCENVEELFMRIGSA